MIANSQFEVITYPLTPEAHQQAAKIAAEMKAHRLHAPSRTVYREGHDEQAILGEMAARKYFNAACIPHEWSGWDLRSTGDHYDFKLEHGLVDVKSRGGNWRLNVDKLDLYLQEKNCNIGGTRPDKPIDIYLFCYYDRTHDTMTVVGWSTPDAYKSAHSYRFVQDGDVLYHTDTKTVLADSNTHIIKARDLYPMHLLGSGAEILVTP